MAAHPPPLVSVVIPTFNQAQYLAESIDSVLGQTYPAVELIVVDDGSTDATPAVIATYGDAIRAIRQDNRGAANALNRGIREARGEYICWLSSDDAFLPEKVAAQVAVFAADPLLGLCFTGFDAVDSGGALVGDRSDLPWIHPDIFVSVFWRNPINGSTVMMPRHVFDEVGQFDESLQADVDAEMWFRVTARHPARHLPGVLLHYRVHGQSLSANRSLMARSKTIVRLRILRDGSLVSRLRAHDGTETPRILAEMSSMFTRQGLRELGRTLLLASVREGRAWHAQWLATGALLGSLVPGRMRHTRVPGRRRALALARRIRSRARTA